MQLNSITIPDLVVYTENAQKTACYEAGLRKIREVGFWDYESPEIKPNAESFSEDDAAELYLATGRLYGFYGIIYKNSQEIAKDFLTAANEIFGQLGCFEKQLICSNYLALSYWRTGETSEAKVWLQTSLNFHITIDGLKFHNPNRLHTFIADSLIYLPLGKYEKVLAQLNKESNNFKACGDPYLLGLFYMNRGMAKELLEDFDGALKDQIKACEIFQSSGQHQLLSYCENNLALYYRHTEELTKAFYYAKRSLAKAEEEQDLRHQGCVNDTLALLHYDKKDYKAALLFAEKSISILSRTECYRYLLDSLETKMQILWALNNKKEAFKTYGEALRLAQDFCTVSDCERITETINNLVSGKTDKRTTEGDLVFINNYLPSNDLREVEITTKHNTSLGLKIGYTAIVEIMPVDNGDFAAIMHKPEDSDEICYLGYIGIYPDLKFISIETSNCALEPFEISEVKILGKVIGYCDGSKDSDSNLIVYPL